MPPPPAPPTPPDAALDAELAATLELALELALAPPPAPLLPEGPASMTGGGATMSMNAAYVSVRR